jgi:hypothetical protein
MDYSTHLRSNRWKHGEKAPELVPVGAVCGVIGALLTTSGITATVAAATDSKQPSYQAQRHTKQQIEPMKYMLTWTERSQGSPIEYENAQKRILEVFTQWKAPANFKIELFVIRVGDWGGYMMLDCDDPTAVHKFCSMLPAFVFEARPVIPIADAVRVELEAIAFRDGLQKK